MSKRKNLGVLNAKAAEKYEWAEGITPFEKTILPAKYGGKQINVKTISPAQIEQLIKMGAPYFKAKDIPPKKG